MTPVSITKPEHSIENGWHVASVSISTHEKTYELKYRVSEGPLSNSSNAFLAAALFPAMKIGQPLYISGPVSPKLLKATETIQNIFNKWFPEFQRIHIKAESGFEADERRGNEVGVFFSGGVDSFYTLLKHQDEITKIILINGIMFEEPIQMPKVTGEIQNVADALGKSLIVVDVNIRDFSEHYTNWEDHYAGVAMESIGLLLSRQFNKIYVSSSFSYERWEPTSIHPLLDPLFSTESLTFEYDGGEASRLEKIAYISESDLAMNSLRVCSKNYSYNCGECEKCLRTMIALRALGILKRCTTFKKELDIEAVSRIKIDEYRESYAREHLEELEQSGKEPELANALRTSIENYEFRKTANLLNADFSGFLASDHGAQFVKGKKNMLFQSLLQEYPGWLLREVLKEKIKELDQKILFGIMRRIYGVTNGKCP